MKAKRAALEALTGRKPAGYGTIDKSLPVYNDLCFLSVMNGELKKLEVATVPE
jgi:hypothetical protein